MSDAEVQNAARTRAELSARMQEILDRPPAPLDPEEVEREKEVVRECRYLMRLLSTRARSEGEMRSRLRERELPGSVIHEVMARIQRAGLIDDAAFAREWVRQRRASKALADEALRRELEAKQVSPADIDSALALPEPSVQQEEHRVRPGMSAEEARCRGHVRERLRRELARRPDATEDPALRRAIARRLDAQLRRRGYDGALALHVISTEMRAMTAD